MKFSMIFSAVDKASKIVGGIIKSSQKLKGVGAAVGKAAVKTGKLVGVGLLATGIGVGGLLAAATQGAIGFESAMADVNKVVEFESPAGFKQFSNDILEMSTRIPMAATALSEIAAEAGAAGIALDDILRFTEFTSKAAVAFDMTAGAAGESFVALRNNYRLTQVEMEGMADAVNHLSNNMASKAPDLITFMNDAAGAAPMIGATAVEMAALGSAMIATGIAPSVAARGMNALATKLDIGGKSVEKSLKMIGLNHKEFMIQMDQDPGKAMIGFFEAVKGSEKGTEALKNLVGLDFVDDFSKIVNRTDLLAESLNLVGDASKYAGAVQDEFAVRAATTANSFELLKNNINVLGVDIGSQVLPSLNAGLEKTIGFLKSAREEGSGVGQAFDSMKGFLVNFFTAMNGWKDKIGDSIGNLGTAFDKVGDTIGRIFSLFTGNDEATTFGHVVGTAVAGAFDILVIDVTAAANALDWVLTGVEKIVALFQGEKVDWADWMPAFSWPEIASFEWPALSSFEWPNLASFEWPKLSAFEWPQIASFEWPNIPMPEMPDVSAAITAMGDKAGAAWGKLKGLFSKKETDPVKIAVQDPASIERALAATNSLKAAVSGLMNEGKAVFNTVQNAINSTTTFLSGVSFYDHGVALMDTLAAGMKSRGQVVVDQMKSTLQEVRNYLPSSPAKVGPLSDIHQLKFSETIARSIKPGPMVKAMRIAAAATMAAAAPTGAFAAIDTPIMSMLDGSRATADAPLSARVTQSASKAQQSATAGISITYSPTIHINGGGAEAKQEFAKLLKAHGPELMRFIDEQIRLRERKKH